MTQAFPDLEIYVKSATFIAIENWLKQEFNSVERISENSKGQPSCHWKVDGHTVLAFGKAVNDFTSIWFKTNFTQWATDLDCAKACAAGLGLETRCSDGGWQESDDENPGWIQIKDGEMRPIAWPNANK